MTVSDLLWDAAVTEIKSGYVEVEDGYICLFCGRKIEKGIVYPEAGVLYEPRRYIRLHIEQAHGSVFAALVRLGKKATGLSEHQTQLMDLFYQGKSDAEVQEAMGIGSPSTIRNHRFLLREKERQARVFIAMMEILREQERPTAGQQTRKKGATTMDRERRKQLIKQYKEVEPQAGVYQIRNTKNNKIFIGSTPNLKTLVGMRGPLEMGLHPNHQLQQEWKECGSDAFVFEVLEILKKRDEPVFDLRDELKKLEKKWLEQLQPYGERGYHRL